MSLRANWDHSWLQTLITASTFRDGLEVAGIVLSSTGPADPGTDPSIASNRDELAARCVSPVLTELKYDAPGFDCPVDWLTHARRQLSHGER